MVFLSRGTGSFPLQIGPKMFTPHPSMTSDEIRERNPTCLGRLLQREFHLETISLCVIHPGTPSILIRIQAVPADVCRNRNCHRQRTSESSAVLGPPACETLPTALSGQTFADS
jgi:hypothetical protein